MSARPHLKWPAQAFVDGEDAEQYQRLVGGMIHDATLPNNLGSPSGRESQLWANHPPPNPMSRSPVELETTWPERLSKA